MIIMLKIALALSIISLVFLVIGIIKDCPQKQPWESSFGLASILTLFASLFLSLLFIVIKAVTL